MYRNLVPVSGGGRRRESRAGAGGTASQRARRERASRGCVGVCGVPGRLPVFLCCLCISGRHSAGANGALGRTCLIYLDNGAVCYSLEQPKQVRLEISDAGVLVLCSYVVNPVERWKRQRKWQAVRGMNGAPAARTGMKSIEAPSCHAAPQWHLMLFPEMCARRSLCRKLRLPRSFIPPQQLPAREVTGLDRLVYKRQRACGGGGGRATSEAFGGRCRGESGFEGGKTASFKSRRRAAQQPLRRTHRRELLPRARRRACWRDVQKACTARAGASGLGRRQEEAQEVRCSPQCTPRE